ncbi:hypothetical protein CcaverHIS631_0408710 [Cutaneotrichosporon cavernicola]|nr:hypothetical protein CcaverHIS631_0408710 [Cutaneotrichosporon cavernicola]
MPIYAFGATPEGHIRAPTRIYPESGNNDARVAFHSWTHAILQTDEGLLELPDTLLSSTKAEVVGTDKPLALLEGGKLVILPSPSTSIHTEWDALAVTDAGPALGVRDGELYAVPCLSSHSASGVKLDHPLLRPPLKVVATESRAAVLSAGEVIEAVWDWRDPGVPRLEVVEELRAESRPKDEADINLVEDDDDDDDDEGITDLALGPDFELVISSGGVWARGNNDFGQLGQGHTRAMEGWWKRTPQVYIETIATMGKVYVIGVGSTKFDKPRGQREYDELGVEAAVKALIDAGVTYDKVETAAAGYVYGDSTCGQRVLYQLGMTGIPIVNVNNNCSTGSSAFVMAVNAVAAGQAECALAVGFERMAPGSLGSAYKDRLPPMEGTHRQLVEIENSKNYSTKETGPGAGRIFGAGGLEYCERYGAKQEHFYKIAAKNHLHSAKNPYSQFRFTPTWQEVGNARKITRELTLPMCSPTSDGGAAAVVASEAFVKANGLEDRAVEVAGWALTTDAPLLYDAKSRIELTGADMARRASKKAYAMAGIGPNDVQVIELHDCFAPNELLTYDALGLSKPGEAHHIVDRGDNTYGGKWVVNPSGGLESKGHPLGATGLGMIFYLTLQVRGEAGDLQVPNVRNALQHNLGLGGACVVSILRKPEFWKKGSTSAQRYGYNVANEVRGITKADLNKVRARQHSDYVPVKVADQARL